MTAVRHLRRTRSPLAAAFALAAAALAAVSLAAFADPDSSAGHQRSRARAAASSSATLRPGCPSAAAAARSRAALAGAERRFRLEAQGAVIHRDLRQIAADPVLLEALRARDLPRALAEANRVLLDHFANGVFVNHVVRLRVLAGGRVIVDANPTSFDVGGSGVTLHGPGGASLGRLQITIQDVIGFDKLVRKLVRADVVVRGAAGQVNSTLPAAARLALPASGCVEVAGRTLAVSSFAQSSFTGEPLTIYVLTPA